MPAETVSRIPTPSRTRPARAHTTTRIPAPRRASRTTTDPTPRQSNLPAPPRRLSKPNDSLHATPTRRPPHRTIATPTRRLTDTPRQATPTPNKTPVRRLSAADGATTARPTRIAQPRKTTFADTPRTTAADDRGLPDRGAAFRPAASPASSRRTPTVSRPALKASPYARRGSHGGGTASVRTPVTRKLNMGSVADADKEEAPISVTRRRLSGAPAVRRVSASTSRTTSDRRFGTDRLDHRRESAADRLERRRESAGVKRTNVSALESFRAARRASLEASDNDAGENESTPVPTEPRASLNLPEPESIALKLDEVLAEAENAVAALPDRSDPITPAKMVTRRTPGKPRRSSARFSDAEICLDNVDRLRSSLGGRRRSHGINDNGALPETPVLRRTSLGKRHERSHGGSQDSCVANAVEGKEPPLLRQRSPLSPLTSISNEMAKSNPSASGSLMKKRAVSELSSKRLSHVPVLDDDDLGWAIEEVEDLGAY